jgi:hypothetical protein
MMEIKISGDLGQTLNVAVEWLQEHIGDIDRTVKATSDKGRWVGFPWHRPALWKESILAYQELTGDIRELDAITIWYGSGWTVLVTEYETIFLIDNDALAVQFKLAVL